MRPVVFGVGDVVSSQMRDVVQPLQIGEALVGFETRHLVAEFAQALQMGLRHAREDRRVVGAPIRMTHGMAGRRVRIRGELGVEELGVGVVLPHRLHPPLVGGRSFVRTGQCEADLVVLHDAMALLPEQPRPLPLRRHPVFETRQLRVRRAVGVLEHPVAEPSTSTEAEGGIRSCVDQPPAARVAVTREAAGSHKRSECDSVSARRPTDVSAAHDRRRPDSRLRPNGRPTFSASGHLIGRGPDWEGILRKAERWSAGAARLHRLAAGCRGRPGARGDHAAPETPLPPRRDYGVVRREALRAILLRLSEASVPVVVLKGAALAALVYPSPTLRPMGDIDLLVHARDRDRAEALCTRARERLAALHIRDHIGSSVPTHRLPAAIRIPIEDIWERARPAGIESVATLVLSHEVFSSSSHSIWRRAFRSRDGFVDGVRTLCDIGETCRRYGTRRLESPRHPGGGLRRGEAALLPPSSANDLVGAGVPSGALTDLRASFGRLPLEDRFIAAVARQAILSEDQATGPPSTFSELAADLLATRRARDGVTVAARLLARSCRLRVRRLLVWPGPWRVRPTGSGDTDPSSGAGP